MIESLNPGEIRLPEQAEKWGKQCERVVANTHHAHQELPGGYGINWHHISEPRMPQANYIPQKVLFLSPHADDMEYAAGVTIADRVMQGDEVSELVFTLGSAGRKSRVYPNSGSSFSTVRLGESILGAKALGIQKLGVITLPGGGLGFEEWLWDGNHPELREVWIGMMRSLNPHTLFSPHPNEKAEQHPDHHAVAVAAQWMTGWGTETDFYAKRYPGSTNNFREWWRYTTWPGSENVTVTDRTVYTSGDKFDQLKQETLSRFPSQNGIGYAQASRGLNLFQGTTAAVGEGATDRMAEQFNVVRPITARHASWRTL